jgi:drug/metabolite transporter (DMT)-like permease
VTRRGWVLFVALGIIWGLPYLLIKISVREISPVFLVFLRTAGGALLLVPIAVAKGAIRPVLRRWKPLLAYTFVEIVVPWLLLFNAERKLSSSLTGLLIASVPLAGAVLAVATGSDRLDARRLTGLLLGLGGVAALVGFDVSGSSLPSALSLGGVAIGYALGPWILSRHLSDLPSLGVVAGSLVVCAVLYAPFAAFEVPQRALSASVIESLVGLTVICTAVAFLVFFALIGEIGPMRTTVITYVNPAVAVLLGVSVLGERFGAGTAVGFVLILGGSFLATRSLRGAARGSAPETALATPPIAEP